MQIARKYLPLDAPCIGVDLVPIRPVPGCVGIVGDITSDSTRSAIRRELKAHPGLASDEKVDVVLNDGSPNMGSAWLQDAYTQSELTLAGVRLATDHLAPGGSFVTKVFRSNDYNSLLFVMNQLFKRVTATKPSASRAESAEIYVFCTGYRAPKSIDPRLLNPKFVFKDWTAEAVAKLKNGDATEAKPDLFLNTVMKSMKKGKRNRDGYEDGNMTLFKKRSVLSFLKTSRPIALITESNQFSFDKNDIEEGDNTEVDVQSLAVVNSLEETNSEILSCCEDLKVLARREFKALIKWRQVARDALISAKLIEGEGEESKDGSDKEKGEDSDGIESDRDIDEELKQARKELMLKEKRKRRKAKKMQSAVQRKIDMKIFLPNESGPVDEEAGTGLFSLKTASKLDKIRAEIVDLDYDNYADDEAESDGPDSEEERIQKAVDRSGGFTIGDSEEAKKAGVRDTERELDMWYKIYAEKAKKDSHGVAMEETKERKRQTKRRALREAAAARAEEAENGEEGGDGEVEETRELELNSDASSSDDDVDMTGELDLGKDPMTERDAALWFSQPMFASSAVLSSDEEMEEKSDEEVDEGAGEGEDIHRAARREARKKMEEVAEKMAADGEADGFETVPVVSQGSQNRDTGKNDEGAESDSSFHSSDYDTDEKAEMVAIGKQMRTSRQKATEVLDDAYNRYTVDDPEGLPRWFADRDPEYRFLRENVSKEQVAEMKAYIKSLQAAPTKKEAEAKARQKARIEKRLEAMKAKANTIAEQSDVSASARMKAIEELYRTASRSSSKGKKAAAKQYQVVRPGGMRTNVGKSSGGRRRGKGSGKVVLVDKRLKSDKRGIKKATIRKGKAARAQRRAKSS